MIFDDQNLVDSWDILPMAAAILIQAESEWALWSEPESAIFFSQFLIEFIFVLKIYFFNWDYLVHYLNSILWFFFCYFLRGKIILGCLFHQKDMKEADDVINPRSKMADDCRPCRLLWCFCLNLGDFLHQRQHENTSSEYYCKICGVLVRYLWKQDHLRQV